MAKTLLSGSNLWETDPRLFQLLHARFQFTVDGAANESNHLLDRWYGPGGEHEDALLMLSLKGEVIYWNPPYNSEQGRFVQRAFEAAAGLEQTTSVVLVPAYTDTAWWQDYAAHALEIWLLRGRLNFFLDGKKYSTARFPSAVLIFGPGCSTERRAKVAHWDWKKAYATQFPAKEIKVAAANK